MDLQWESYKEILDASSSFFRFFNFYIVMDDSTARITTLSSYTWINHDISRYATKKRIWLASNIEVCVSLSVHI